MLKKVVLGGLLASTIGGVALGTGAWSYVRTAGGWVQDVAQDAVPLEWEIQRARQMIADLDPEITENAKRIAQEKIKVAKLEKEYAAVSEKLADSQENIARLRGDLELGSSKYTYCGKTYTAAQVREDLGRRFSLHKTRKEMADNLGKMLDARQQTLTAATDRMEAMMSAKRQLEVEVENLQAKLASVRLAQTSSELALDDSALSQTRELLDTISARIDVEKEMTQVSEDYFGGIQLDEESEADLMDEIAAYFDGGQSESEGEKLAGIQLDGEER